MPILPQPAVDDDERLRSFRWSVLAMSNSNNDEEFATYCVRGDINGVKKTFDKGVGRNIFDIGVRRAALNGYLDILKFLLNNSDDINHHVQLADRYTSEDNRYLKIYLLRMKRNFVIHKRYEVE